ncbi:MAG TPA: GWxTD domain-containing protein, partial [Pyrinomonadaceae bacterium]|nr:GWxTD domain-containing protein [Pyrinomonadaceae bacterium]
MFSQKFSRRLLIATLVINFSAPATLLAQQQQQQPARRNQQQGQQQPDDPSTRQRNERPEMNKHYRDWLENDVRYLISDDERNVFKKLRTDEEREQFIEAFWRRRDPNPDTDENEFREEYYERIAYANEHFASGVPGWRTDRGRIYITFGKPDEIESHPAGGPYERPYWEGGGSTSTYPFEIWFYRYIEGVGSGVEIEFVDPTGSGEYHIARSPQERDALLMVPGAGLTLAESLGLSSKTDRILGMGQWANGGEAYQRTQDQPFERLELLSRLSRPPAVKYNDLLSLSNTPVIEDNPLNFDVRVDFFRQSDERVITAITIQMENHNLVFQDSGGVQQAIVNIFGKITSVSGQRAGTFEDPVTTQATAEELASARERKSAYQKAVALTPGTYKVDVVVRDVNSGATGVRHLGFTVPRYNSEQLSTSTL